MGKGIAAIAGVTATLVLLSACGQSSVPAPDAGNRRYEVSIRRSAHGIPHIRARDFASLGYGYGYAAAQDNLCALADFYVTVNGERSRWFGADAEFEFPANEMVFANADSDFFFALIKAQGVVEGLLQAPAPTGPRAEVRELVRGYVDGFNRYLRETGVDAVPDPVCRGAPWLREIAELDAYRMFHSLGLFAGSGASIDGIGGAAPVLGGAKAQGDAAAQSARLAQELRTPQGRLALLNAGLRLRFGSNGIGIGRDGSANGRGVLLGNPHFPWNGAGRFYQVQLTIPGRLDVSGATFLGLPLVVMGANRDVAWTHTTSTAFRFVPHQLLLAGPTTYLVDGVPEAMQAWPLRIAALQADGSVAELERTLYTTRYGPMVTTIAGLNLFVWTPVLGFAIADPNMHHMRYLDHFYEMATAGNVGEIKDVLDRTQGIPWANTIAVDRAGDALYADISVVPNVPDAHAVLCGSVLGLVTHPLLGLPILDGARSACTLRSDENAAQPGIMPPQQLPSLIRGDYVSNSNDSHWLPNVQARLEGFARIVGNERTERSLRTRLGLMMIEERLAGSDGKAGRGFTHEQMRELMYANRVLLGELWRDDLVDACRGMSDTGAACDALAGWNLRDDLDASGVVLFRHIAANLLGITLPAGTVSEQRIPLTGVYATPFDADDPVHTPRGISPLSLKTRRAIRSGIDTLQAAGIPLDARLGDHQFALRNGERIALHGGTKDFGQFNALEAEWQPEAGGWVDPYHAATFVQVVSFDDSACPRISSQLTYSQSNSTESPLYAGQLRLYADKQWVEVPFCDADIEAQTLQRLELN